MVANPMNSAMSGIMGDIFRGVISGEMSPEQIIELSNKFNG